MQNRNTSAVYQRLLVCRNYKCVTEPWHLLEGCYISKSANKRATTIYCIKYKSKILLRTMVQYTSDCTLLINLAELGLLRASFFSMLWVELKIAERAAKCPLIQRGLWGLWGLWPDQLIQSL